MQDEIVDIVSASVRDGKYIEVVKILDESGNVVQKTNTREIQKKG